MLPPATSLRPARARPALRRPPSSASSSSSSYSSGSPGGVRCCYSSGVALIDGRVRRFRHSAWSPLGIGRSMLRNFLCSRALRPGGARRTRSDGSSGNLGKPGALAHNRRNSARSALYRAPPRLHSEPPMTTSPSIARTDHFHLPRPRRFSTMSNVAKRSSSVRQVTLRT
jgi:hypothetical protein